MRLYKPFKQIMKNFNEAFYDMNLTQSDRIFLIVFSGKTGR